MARKTDEKLNINAEVRKLMSDGPQRLYLLWGPEDYLREYYLEKLKKLCLPDGDDSFSYKRINGPELDPDELLNAVDAVPFLTERSFVELRDIDINRLPSGERILKILSDIPEYCTVVFVQNAEYEPDGRFKQVKALRAMAQELVFTRQNQSDLTRWITKRFGALGKGIEFEAAQRLIFISGDLMNRLIPEIEKIAAYAKGERVTVADVEAVANHIPEAVIFTMTELFAQRKFNNAFAVLTDLLSDRTQEPIAMLGMLGVQMRRLYGAKLAQEQNLGIKYVMDACGCKDYQANKLLQAARGFSLPQLCRAVELCAETDYRMKSSGQDDRELFKEVVLRIAAGDGNA
jgi:DNA polymerase-3 subunit delta